MFCSGFRMYSLCKKCTLQLSRETCKGRLTFNTKLAPPVFAGAHEQRRSYYGMQSLAEYYREMKKYLTARSRDAANIGKTPTADKFGDEVAIAHFLIKADVSVHFTNGRWYGKLQKKRSCRLPFNDAVGYSVNAVNARGTLLDNRGFKDLVKLQSIKYLDLEGCMYVDDQCLASLVHIRDSLTHLNINRCERVTQNGIATLHKLRKLERLNMRGLPNTSDLFLVASMLEDLMPSLKINIITETISNLSEEDIGNLKMEKEDEDMFIVLDKLSDMK